MRLISTSAAESGDILGKSIYNEKGQALLTKGVRLDAKLLSRLKQMGITYLYIMDERTEDIVYRDPLPFHLRKQAIEKIESVFKEVNKELDQENSLVLEKASKQLKDIIRSLLDEIRNDQHLISIMSDVYAYDSYIFTHSLNVTLYSLAIGMKLQLPAKQLETLGLGAMLHDVGKMKVPADILLKPGKLTEEEFKEIKGHAESGFQILRGVQTVPLLVAHCAYQHHERLNGSGYPRGLMDKDIIDFAKVIAVADVFDAVTSNRIYRQAMLPHEGLEILYTGADKLYDKNIIEAFRKSVALYPVGMTVVLNDGRKGIVSSQNSGLCDRPIVRIIENNGVELEPYECDLSKELSAIVISCDTTLR